MDNVRQTQLLDVVDGEGLIAGRLSSKVAKMLLKGRRVRVINAEKVLLSGEKKSILREWRERLEISSAVHPRHGPFHPRRPDGILSRIIRGMLPMRTPRGLEAFKRLRVYIGIPNDLSSSKTIVFDQAKASKPRAFYFSLGDVGLEIGWHGDGL